MVNPVGDWKRYMQEGCIISPLMKLERYATNTVIEEGVEANDRSVLGVLMIMPPLDDLLPMSKIPRLAMLSLMRISRLIHMSLRLSPRRDLGLYR
jgi:hypothetical protein